MTSQTARRTTRRLAVRLVRRVPWWCWAVLALAVIGRVDDRWLRWAGVAGGVLVIGLVARLIRRRRPPLLGDWRDAERLAAAWLHACGCRSVTETAAGADRGIDVLTREWAVQVKHRSARTGRPAVQQILGAALDVDRRPALISTSGFTAPAIEFADAHGVALVELDADGRGRRINGAAREIGRRRGRGFRRFERSEPGADLSV